MRTVFPTPHTLLAAAIVLVTVGRAHAQAPVPTPDARVHVETVTSDATWLVRADSVPRNTFLRIENIGATTVAGGQVLANGKDWSTVDGLLAQIVRPGMSNDAKARAIWQFARDQRYHWYSVSDHGGDSADPVKFFGFYGYGLCGDVASALATLFRRAGFPARLWNPGTPPAHVVVEAFYDGTWHLFDADRNGLYLRRDNATVAGIVDLMADPWLVERAGDNHLDLAGLYAQTPGEAWWPAPELDTLNLSPVRLTLRPREAITLRWDNEGRARRDTTATTDAPPVFANGSVETLLLPGDLPDAPTLVRLDNVRVDGSGADARWTAIDPSRPAEAVYLLQSPFPIVGATLDGPLGFTPGGGHVRVYASTMVDDVNLVGNELAFRRYRVPGLFVADRYLATYAEDGAFPFLHAAALDLTAAVVFKLERRGSERVRVGGLFFRRATVDELAISVSADGEYWRRVWQPGGSQVGYFRHLEDVTDHLSGGSLYVRYEFTARSGEHWTAGLQELSITGVAVPIERPVWSSSAPDDASAPWQIQADLSGIVAAPFTKAAHQYLVRVVLHTLAPGAVGIGQLRVRTVFQAALNGLPGLGPGENVFTYRDDTAGASRVKVTHAWNETGAQVPLAPRTAFTPADGGAAATSGTFSLAWAPAQHPDGLDIFQYHVQVCADAICSSALASPFDIYTSGTDAGPDGIPGTSDDKLKAAADPAHDITAPSWFVPGRTYHWHVRAQDVQGTWSPFSDIWRFVAADAEPGRRPEVTVTTAPMQTTSPTVTISGTLSSVTGLQPLAWWTDRGDHGLVASSASWTIEDIPVGKGTTHVFVQATDAQGRQSVATVPVVVKAFVYYLAEGMTGPLFDTDVVIVNPSARPAPVVIEFLADGNIKAMRRAVVESFARLLLRVDEVWGTRQVPTSVRVSSTDAVPLVVERSMFWGQPAYGGHAGRAVTEPRTRWLFAEGAQGFFDTYVLLQNPNAVPAKVDVQFLLGSGRTVRGDYVVPPNSRHTIATGQIAALVDQAFSIDVTSDQPVVAERAMYFGANRFWEGGHGAPGNPEARTSWLHAEGATGPYFDTFLLIGNPNRETATVDVDYFTAEGRRISRRYVVEGRKRETINIELEAPELANTAVSTRLRSNVPIVTERAMYWPGEPTQWLDAHVGVGTASSQLRWGLADGRVGQPLDFETYVLLTNEDATRAARVQVTFIRNSGPPVVKVWTVAPSSRFNLHVNSMVPELRDESFSMVFDVTNGVPVAVERAMYWGEGAVHWVAGTSVAATPLPPL